MQAVPVDYKENAYALGCNKLQAIWCVIMPAAISGISAAIMLGMARAIGETMIVVILAGGNSSLPHDPTESMRPMTATIADVDIWRSWFLPGLHDCFGWAWPVIVGLAAAAMTLLMVPWQVRWRGAPAPSPPGPAGR